MSSTKNEKFLLHTALSYRDTPSFASWLDEFLRGPGNNVALADGLARDRRWWIGPTEMALSSLTMKCGPGLEFHEDPADWENRIEALADAIERGLEVLPLIAEFKNGLVTLADGNHRCAALLRCGIEKYWVAIWFNSENEWSEFSKGRKPSHEKTQL